MLTELCQELHNWFTDKTEIQFGSWRIEDGSISLPFLLEGQFFRIVGSVYNDGVHVYGETVLADEEFTGAIWPMKIPVAIIMLDEKISNWQKKNAEAVESPYQSESWGGYSYTLKSGGTNSSAAGVTWQGVFANELNRWRKL